MRGCRRTQRRRTCGLVAVVVAWAAACDDDGATGPDSPNRAPQAVGTIPERTVSIGETVSVDVSPYFGDPDGDALSYEAASSNAAVVGVSVSGGSVAVIALAKGLVTITVAARDPAGLIAQQRFQVTVPNRAPEAVDAVPAQTVFVGQTASVDASAHFRDPDGDPLSYAAVSSNAGVAGASASGNSVAVTGLASGTVTIVVTATDPEGLAAQQRFEVTVPNRAPEPVGEIPAQTMSAGETATVDVSGYFRDPDGDPLTYSAVSSNGGVASVSAAGSSVTVSALATGGATVTVTATDPGGLSATSSFGVTVRTSSPGGFQIEVVFATPVTASQEAAVRAAAERWMAILAPTDLPDVPLDRTVGCGGDPRFQRFVGTVDDVIAVVAVAEIDGPGRVLGRAGPCWLRASSFPFYGRIELDAADLERLEQTGDLEELVLHEMGHVLGIGAIWDRRGLLRNPATDTRAPDTHFAGRRAIAAFDDAGGTGYAGAKVPVENTGSAGSRNSHWRESVMALELMTSSLFIGVREPLSAITIQSLADLGYDVDPTLAEPYRLPGADLARALEAAPRIPYGDDIWRGPLVFVDPEGRIVRVIPR